MASWQSFYVIVGSAGAALIGIQFVVVTLVASMRRRPPEESFSAFGTPTVVHLTSAMLISAVMNVPWPSLLSAAVAITACGLAGLGYGAVTIRRMRRQTYYEPVWQDWVWYALHPSVAYIALVVAAFFLLTRTQTALFGVGAVALALLMIGIHNSWDSVTHLVVGVQEGEEATSE